MDFSEKDKEYMSVAIAQARLALEAGDFPVGAVLSIGGEMVDKTHNRIVADNKWTSHAEMGLILKHAFVIRDSVRKKDLDVAIYTTLEPCIMCLGTCVMNRVSRIVYACPDPFVGTKAIQPEILASGYGQLWPKIEGGLMKVESKKFLLQFLTAKAQDSDKWRTMKELLEEMG